MPELIVCFNNVAFSYDHTEVLHDVSFTLGKGEVVGLLGPNGAGKTTTIRIIAGILTPRAGTVSVLGLSLPERAVSVKQRIGYVPETAALFESLTGQEFLELCGRLHGLEEDTLQARIHDILETFALSSDRVSGLDTYSKGMRQKILIAAALLHNPDLILLDEPLSGLDVNAAMLVKDLIAALASQGRTILYSSHVLDVVEKVCDRVLIIHEGRLLGGGSPESLKAATGQETLEDVFRKLTDAASVDPGVARILGVATMNAIQATVRRFLRGPAVSRLLAKLDIDARRYWVLMGILFGGLSDSHEMLSQLGRDDFTLKVVAVLYFIVTGLGSILFVIAQPRLALYLVASLCLSAFFLLGVVISETGNSIVNPVEGLVLAHQPVNGATYTAAKLSHLLRIILYLVSGLNTAPALAGLALKGARWYYPILHMMAAFAVGLTLALLCCAAFGWLVRFVPPARLKSAAQAAELTPWIAIFILFRSRAYLAHLRVSQWLPAGTGTRAGLAAALIIAAAFIVVFGIRALSADYLIRVSAIVHGGSRRAKVRTRRPRIADLVAWLGGGPVSRAGFEYVSRMMLRDWQFRRQMILLTPFVIMPVVALASGRLRVDPFSRQLTMVHALPHIAGVVLFRVCTALPYGADYKGSWIFLLVPAGAYGKFARGVFARLWLEFIVNPHVVLLIALAWVWGIPDAVLFIAYSTAAASAYLSLELRLIDGVPFTRPLDTSQTAYQMPFILLGVLVMVIAVGLQYFLVFRSRAVVVAAAIVVGAAAWIMTRSSLSALERLTRLRLGLLTAESGNFYKEIG